MLAPRLPDQSQETESQGIIRVIIRGKNFKTTVLLGAGATRGAVRHALLNRKRIKPPLNRDFFNVASTFARACGSNSSEAKRLARLLKFFKNDLAVKGKPAMEDAFSLLYVVKDFPTIYGQRRGRKLQPGSRKEIDDFLFLAFGILGTLDSNASLNNGYDRLASRLGSGDTIISLNYDTLLDSALARAGWNPKVGYDLAGSSQKVKWRVTNCIDQLREVHLLKLHGSLNWFVRGNSISSVFEKKPVRITIPRNNGLKGHMRQIVPPIYGKFFQHKHWRHLWESANKALREADVLVIVGCSLVDTDFHLRALMSRVGKFRKTTMKKFHRLILVDHNLRVRRKWGRVLKGSSQRIVSIKGYEKFLKEELGV